MLKLCQFPYFLWFSLGVDQNQNMYKVCLEDECIDFQQYLAPQYYHFIKKKGIKGVALKRSAVPSFSHMFSVHYSDDPFRSPNQTLFFLFLHQSSFCLTGKKCWIQDKMYSAQFHKDMKQNPTV